MIKSIILNVLICIVLLIRCKHEEIIPVVSQPQFGDPEFFAGSKEFGFANGIKDSLRFEASAYATFHENNHAFVAMELETFSQEGFLREHLILNEIPVKAGNYTIMGKAWEFNDNLVGSLFVRLEDDGDAVGAYYYENNVNTNSIIVEKIDTFNREIEGRFNVSFINKDTLSNSLYPKLIQFKDIIFKMKIIQ